ASRKDDHDALVLPRPAALQARPRSVRVGVVRSAHVLDDKLRCHWLLCILTYAIRFAACWMSEMAMDAARVVDDADPAPMMYSGRPPMPSIMFVLDENVDVKDPMGAARAIPLPSDMPMRLWLIPTATLDV